MHPCGLTSPNLYLVTPPSKPQIWQIIKTDLITKRTNYHFSRILLHCQPNQICIIEKQKFCSTGWSWGKWALCQWWCMWCTALATWRCRLQGISGGAMSSKGTVNSHSTLLTTLELVRIMAIVTACAFLHIISRHHTVNGIQYLLLQVFCLQMASVWAMRCGGQFLFGFFHTKWKNRWDIIHFPFLCSWVFSTNKILEMFCFFVVWRHGLWRKSFDSCPIWPPRDELPGQLVIPLLIFYPAFRWTSWDLFELCNLAHHAGVI